MTNEDTTATIAVLGNDTDPDKGGTIDVTSVVVTSGPTHGTVSYELDASLKKTGKILYTPAADYSGPDSFKYRVNDNLGTPSAEATVNITVNAVDDAPVVSAIETTDLTYTELDPATIISSTLTITDVDDTHLERAVIEITGNYTSPQDVLGFTDAAGDNITQDVAASTGGKLVLQGHDTLANYIAALRTVTYRNTSTNPNVANRTVSFVVNDGDLNSLAKTRTIKIIPVNHAPEAYPDTYGSAANPVANEDAVYRNTGSSVLANDLEPLDPEDVLSVASFDATSQHGATIMFDKDPTTGKYLGTFTYDPRTRRISRNSLPGTSWSTPSSIVPRTVCWIPTRRRSRSTCGESTTCPWRPTTRMIPTKTYPRWSRYLPRACSATTAMSRGTP